MIYLIILFIMFILAFLNISDERIFPKYEKILLILLFIFLFIFAAFRYDTGYDFNSYKQIFDNLNFNKIFLTDIEIGFSTVVCCIKALGLGYQWLILLIASISLLFKYKAIEKYSIYPFVSLMIYFSSNFIIQDFGQMRQGLAVALALYSIQYIKDQKLIKFLSIIFIAIMFHYSAIVFVPLYWLSKLDLNLKAIISILGISIALFIIMKTGIIEYILYNIIKSQFLINKYIAYTSKGGYLGFLKLTFIFRVGIFILFYLLKDKIKPNCKYYNVLATGYLLSIFMYIAFNSNVGLATRGSIYFKMLEIFIIPQIIYAVKDKIIVFNLLFIFYLLTFKDLFFEVSSFKNNFIPYKSTIMEFLKYIFT